MAKHSIILSSYNRPKHVALAIRSVLDQTVKDLELLIMDDGSDASTLASIERAVNNDQRCKIFLHPDGDQNREKEAIWRYASRINEALKVLDGDVVHYLADDDRYCLTRLEIFNDLFAKPEVVVGYGGLFYDYGGYGRGHYPKAAFHIITTKVLDLLDHNQVAHRSLTLEKVPEWPTHETYYNADGHYFELLLKHWKFCGVYDPVAIKNMHNFRLGLTKDNNLSKRE